MIFVVTRELNGCILIAKLEVRRDFFTLVAWHVAVDFEGNVNLLQHFGIIHLGEQIFFHRSSAVETFNRMKVMLSQLPSF